MITEEQLDRAVEAVRKNTSLYASSSVLRHRLRVAAPYLQAPLESPQPWEVERVRELAFDRRVQLLGVQVLQILSDFVALRNSPPPPDPLLEKIVDVIQDGGYKMTSRDLAALILAVVKEARNG